MTHTETIVDFTESEQGHYIGSWTVKDAPNEFLRGLAEQAIRDGIARGIDKHGCIVTASIIVTESIDDYGHC